MLKNLDFNILFLKNNSDLLHNIIILQINYSINIKNIYYTRS
jgi:hypothetical protein